MAGENVPCSKSPKQVRAALYARVSTSSSSQNPDMQLLELRSYCERRNWGIAGEFVDAGIPAISDAWIQMLADRRE